MIFSWYYNSHYFQILMDEKDFLATITIQNTFTNSILFAITTIVIIAITVCIEMITIIVIV